MNTSSPFKRSFDSVYELLESIQQPTDLLPEQRSSIVGTKTFTGTKTLEEAIDLAERGWDEGVDLLRRMHAEIEEMLEGQIPVPEVQYDVIGDVADIGRAVTGDPEFMMEMVDFGLRRDAPIAKVVHMVYNMSAGGAASKDTMLRRAAAMCVAADVLERHGVRCKIDVVYISAPSPDLNDKRPRAEVTVTVKPENEYLSFDKLAFLMGHRSSLRRVMFAVMEHMDPEVRKSLGIGRGTGGYGFPNSASEHGDVYMEAMLTNVDWSEKFTTSWLRQTLKKHGLVLREEDV